jgi:hypothetical protein
MTLDEALAVYLYFQAADTLQKREERVLDTAWKIIDERARKAIEAPHDRISGIPAARHVNGCADPRKDGAVDH